MLLWLLTPEVSAGDSPLLPEKVVVGTLVSAPFSIKTEDGHWKGFSIELWHAVARDLNVSYEVREFDNIGKLVTAVEMKNIDAIIGVAQTEKRESLIDFSNAYYMSGSAIAVPIQGGGPGWARLAVNFISWDFLTIILLLVLLWLIAGTCVYLFECRRNREMFGGGIVKGLGQGIWWAAVTMSTVGYGDKAPKTLGGRIVAIFWMFSSIMLISSFTAAITTQMTVGELRGKIRGLQDLPGVRVGSVAHSESLNFLTDKGIVAQQFDTESEGVQAIAESRIDAFVYNAAILKHLIKNDFSTQVQVLPGTFDDYYIGMGFPTLSPIREPINRALLRLMDTRHCEQTDFWYKLK
jgi:polar amino acid transport system substrate-binding protein